MVKREVWLRGSKGVVVKRKRGVIKRERGVVKRKRGVVKREEERCG